MRTRLKDLKEVKILDDHTVRMTLSQPMAPFLSCLAITLPLYPKDSLPMTRSSGIISPLSTEWMLLRVVILRAVKR